MAKSSKTVQICPDSSTPGIVGSHAHLIERLRTHPPYRFDPKLNAQPDQVEIAADTIRCNFLAFEQYVVAALRDIADHTNYVRPDILYIKSMFDDLRGEVCGSIERASAKAVDEALFGRRAA